MVGYSGEKHVDMVSGGKGKFIFPLLICFISRIFRSAGLLAWEMNKAGENDFVNPSVWDTQCVLRE